MEDDSPGPRWPSGAGEDASAADDGRDAPANKRQRMSGRDEAMSDASAARGVAKPRPHLLEAFGASTEAERAALWDAASDEERADVVAMLRDMKQTVAATAADKGAAGPVRRFAARCDRRDRAGGYAAARDLRHECGDARLAGVWCRWAFLGSRERARLWREFAGAAAAEAEPRVGDDDRLIARPGSSAAWRACVAAQDLDLGTRPACQWCGRSRAADARLLACTRCRAARYCSADHQRAHWKAGHRKDCRATVLAGDYTPGGHMHPIAFAAWLRARLHAETAGRDTAGREEPCPMDES